MNRKNILRLTIVLLLLSSILFILEVTNTTHFFHKDKTINITPSSKTPTVGGGSSFSDKGSQSAQNNVPASSISSPSSSTQNESKSTPSTAITSPSGSFVSAHKVKLDSPIVSVCNTTPGATCKISFANSDISRDLPLTTADASGKAQWENWTPQSIGIQPGTWSITATSSLNGQVKSTQDALQLEVAQ